MSDPGEVKAVAAVIRKTVDDSDAPNFDALSIELAEAAIATLDAYRAGPSGFKADTVMVIRDNKTTIMTKDEYRVWQTEQGVDVERSDECSHTVGRPISIRRYKGGPG